MYSRQQYEKLIIEAWEQLGGTGIEAAAGRCGMSFNNGKAAFDSLGRTFGISAPGREITDGAGLPAPRIFQVVVLHHLLRADGSAATGKPVPLHAFPDLMLYRDIIKWRVLDVLAGAFGDSPGLLRETAAALGGVPAGFGDAAATLLPLPLVPWTAVIHAGDDEFPAGAQVLLDESAPRLLPMEDMVVLSELLARRLANMAGEQKRKD
jgi:hypothetical protein